MIRRTVANPMPKLCIFNTREALEGGKELVRLIHVKTDSVVPDKINQFPAYLHNSKLYDRLILSDGVLPGITERIV